jgi:hypothetical protein
MNKEKLCFLPLNAFFKIPTFTVIYYLLNDLAKIDNFASLWLAFCIYFIDVAHSTEIDYLSDRIKKLEDSQK